MSGLLLLTNWESVQQTTVFRDAFFECKNPISFFINPQTYLIYLPIFSLGSRAKFPITDIAYSASSTLVSFKMKWHISGNICIN